MCRFAAYLGPEIRLGQFLFEPSHNLLAQAARPREMKYATFNADGFGIGWFNDHETPAVYSNTLPIWADANLPHLGRSLYGNLWLAAVRSATLPFTTHFSNTQPFYDEQLLFLHNGFLDNFSTLRRTIRDFLEPHIEADIQGTTDSEHLFALLRHLLTDDTELSIEDALLDMFDLLETWLGEGVSLLNVVVSDGERIYAVRHAVNADCPSLYYAVNDDAFPQGQLLASEPLTDSQLWESMPEHHLLTLDPVEPPELIPL
jgi:glutamine amidotransferase